MEVYKFLKLSSLSGHMLLKGLTHYIWGAWKQNRSSQFAKFGIVLKIFTGIVLNQTNRATFQKKKKKKLDNNSCKVSAGNISSLRLDIFKQ